MPTVKTSKGEIDLTRDEYALLEKVLSDSATAEEGQLLYQGTSARGLPFPMEWEVHVLRATLAAFPRREDIIQRLAIVEGALSSQVTVEAESIDRLAWERAWARFAGTSLLGTADPDAAMAARANSFADACTLLSSPYFGSVSIERRVATMLALHDTLISAPSTDLVIVADLGLRQFRRLLDDPALTSVQAMGIFDVLHSLYFSGVTDVLDLRRFDAIVPIFEDWLFERFGPANPRPALPAAGAPLTIAYLLHTAHFDRGNAVSPLIVSLAHMHAAVPNRRVFLYLVSYVGAGFIADVADRAFTVRSFPQGRSYDRMDEIAASLRKDRVDVVITEQNRAIAGALFARRVAPVQMWADTGFPFWSLRSLDWTLSPAKSGPPDVAKRESALIWRQVATTLQRDVDPAEVTRVRKTFPPDAFVLGVFVRLVKLTGQFFRLLDTLLATEPTFRLVIAGTGDPNAVNRFLANTVNAKRITFLHENVDLNVYGKVINVMCDTFPFIGGYACREIAAQGTPVVSMLGTRWDDLLREERSPDLLAHDEAEYVELVRRLYSDREFYARQKRIVLENFVRQTDPTRMIDDVESGIAAAVAHGAPAPQAGQDDNRMAR